MNVDSRKILSAEFSKLGRNKIIWWILAFLTLIFISYLWHYGHANWHRGTSIGPHATLSAFQLAFFSMLAWPFIILSSTIAVFYPDFTTGMLMEQVLRLKSLPRYFAMKLIALMLLLSLIAILFSLLAAVVGLVVPLINAKIDFTIDNYNIYLYLIMAPSLLIGGLFFTAVIFCVLVLTKNVAVSVFGSLVVVAVGVSSGFGDYFGYNPTIFHGSIPNGINRYFSESITYEEFPFVSASAFGFLLFVGLVLLTIEIEGRKKILG